MALPERWRVASDFERITSGQAEVFPVRQADDATLYALKRLRNPKRAARFAREVETMATLRAAGLAVPPIIDSGTTGELPYFVMPWCKQGSLEARVVGRAYTDDLDAGLALLIDLTETLMRVHQLQIAHRDLKPANVLLDDERAILTDFGLSLSASEDDPADRLTETAEAVGSRLYIAPENEGGFNDEVDQRPADFYAMGKLSWAVLAGHQPPSRENQRLVEHRLSTLYGDSDFEPLDVLFGDLIGADPRVRLTEWEPVLVVLQETRARLGGDAQASSPSNAVETAIASAKRWRGSGAAVKAAKLEEASTRRQTAINDLRQSLLQGARSRDRELSDLSNVAPMLRIQAGDGYALSNASKLVNLRSVGLEPPGQLAERWGEVHMSPHEGAAAAMRIEVEAGSRTTVQLGVHTLLLGDKVWAFRCVLVVAHDPHSVAIAPALSAEYGSWAGPWQLGLATSRQRAEASGAELVDLGIRLFGECADHLAAGRQVSDPAIWVPTDQGSDAADDGGITERIRTKLSGELEAEAARQGLHDAGADAVGQLQELTAPLNARLREAHPDALIDGTGDKLTENMMRTLDEFGGREILFRWQRHSEIGTGPDYLRYSLRFGRGLEVTSDGALLLHGFVDVGNPETMGADFYWHAPENESSLDAAESTQVLRDFVAECERQINRALQVFAEHLDRI